MSILTPEQIATLAYALEWDKPMSDTDKIDLAHTITAYAEVVQEVAEGRVIKSKWCIGDYIDHVDVDEDTYLVARELRGL